MIIKKLFTVFIALFFMALASCNSGGGDGDSHSDTTPTGMSLTPGGYPDVVGTYSFTTEKISYTCTDGSSGTGNEVANNTEISQSENIITGKNPSGSSGVTPGVHIIESTGLTGNIQKNGDVVLNNYATATVDGVSGNVTLQYHIDGKFTATGWSGNYDMTTFFQSAGVTCTSMTTFSGDKLSGSKSTSNEVTRSETQDINDEDVNDEDGFHNLITLLGHGFLQKK